MESSGRDGPDGVGVAPSSSSSWNSKSSAVRLAVTESGEGMIVGSKNGGGQRVTSLWLQPCGRSK